MNAVYATIGWIWSRKLFFLLIAVSAVFFFAWFFPFSDLSDVVTSRVAQATGGEVYVQFDDLNLHLVPQPAISATNLEIETSLPPLNAKWAKFTPGLMDALTSIPAMIKAANGNPEAAANLETKIGATISTEGVLGGDVELRLRPGNRSEGGHDRSRVSLSLDKINLNELQKWGDLPVKMQGTLNFDTDVQFTPDFQDQPEGEYNLRVSKMTLPGGTMMVPMNGVMMPLSVPLLTFANLNLRGRMVNGKFFIEEGVFGQNKDPLFGKIKGNLEIKIVARGPAMTMLLGSYDLTVDLTTTQLIEKDLGFAFFLFGPGKSGLPGGGAHYLFKAAGASLVSGQPPTITRATSF